ncbi:saccharopine dehydrogenase NADP-binding domain-containing protein, partial [Streptomyces durbertensis]|nr:saccharopine dehydrogenase NADP-binding domain-containing protein [Streptomyces durbertensis]
MLVVGGYGAVGATVTTALSRWFPGRVLPAGRDPRRARRAGGVTLDVSDPAALHRVLDETGTTLVVLCVEPPDESAARTCLERGIHLVDVNATPLLLQRTERLHDAARAAGATAALSVGVAPGLTNLLARRAHDAVGGAERLDLTVLLGTGEHHGQDAVRWTVAGLAEPAPHPATAHPLRVELPGFGARTAHPFPFSDQHTLPGTLDVPHVTTRLCLDSRPLTATLFALRRAGLRRALRRPAVRRALTRAFSAVHLGGEDFALRADARHGDRHAAFALTGSRQSEITGLVAAHTAKALLDGLTPAGVHHLEQLPALADLPERLASHGVTLHRQQPP